MPTPADPDADSGAAAAAAAFGDALDAQLGLRHMSRADLARAIGVDRSYITKLANGTRAVSPAWANAIADTLASNATERHALNLAAARSWGYDLDFSVPKSQEDS